MSKPSPDFIGETDYMLHIEALQQFKAERQYDQIEQFIALIEADLLRGATVAQAMVRARNLLKAFRQVAMMNGDI